MTVIDPALYAKLQKLCLQTFPGRLEQRVSQVRAVVDPRRPAWSFVLTWRQGRQTRVERLRLLSYADRRTLWNADDPGKARRAWTVMRWLYGEGLPVPRSYAIGDGEDEGTLLVAHVSDRPTDALWDKSAGSRSTAEQAARVDELAQLLARLHHLVPPQVVREVVPQVTVNGQMDRLQEIGKQLQNEGIVQAARELQSVQMEERPPCVLHGEPALDKVRHDARGITSLEDWETSVRGDPRWDAARVVVWLKCHHSPDLAGRFCRTYEDRSDAPFEGVLYWETAAALQQWAVGLSRPDKTQELEEQVALWSEHAWRGLVRLRAARSE